VLPGHVWTTAFDEVVVIGLEAGDVVDRHPCGAEVATLVGDGDAVLVVTVDGRIARPAR